MHCSLSSLKILRWSFRPIEVTRLEDLGFWPRATVKPHVLPLFQAQTKYFQGKS